MTDHAISELVTRKRLIESVATKCDGWWGRDSETGMQRVFRADEPIPDAAVPWWNLGGINGERATKTEIYSASVTESLCFRVIQHDGCNDYLLEWKTLNGTIMTITSIRISRDGLLATADVLAEVAEKIMEAPVAS